MALADRQHAVEITLRQLENQSSTMRPRPRSPVSIEAIPTGCLALDAALGVGGFPRGRIAEVFGPESSGKTTLALQTIAEAQRAGATAAFIDAEHALDPDYAQTLGVDNGSLLFSRPGTGEQALEITSALVNSRAVDLIVVDSVAALVPREELESEIGGSGFGLHSRMMSQALRKLAGTVARTNACLIFLNQIRGKAGVTVGNPETTSGGRALQFYAAVRAEVRRAGGTRTRVRIVKNKAAAPFREAEFDLLDGAGFSRERELIELGVGHGIVEETGISFRYRGERIGQGRDAAEQFLRERGDVAGMLEAELRSALGLPARSPEPRKTGLPAL